MSQPPITSSSAILGTQSWENEGGRTPTIECAEKLGAIRHLTETYSVGEFRYTSLTGAIAQARTMTKIERELT